MSKTLPASANTILEHRALFLSRRSVDSDVSAEDSVEVPATDIEDSEADDAELSPDPEPVTGTASPAGEGSTDERAATSV